MMHNRFYTPLLFLALAALSVFFYAKTIAGPPSHIHVWTQSDRYALALGFLDNGFDFLHPRVFNLEPGFPHQQPGTQSGKGITGVDFPIHEYLVAGLMKLLGTRAPGIFRLYTLIFSIIGVWMLFRLTRNLTGSAEKGIVAAVFIFTAPILTYYQSGFIPSAPGFAATLIGYFFYFRYRETALPVDFRWAIGFLALAALGRSPFNIFLFAVLLQQGLGWWRRRRAPRAEVLAFVVAYALIIGWQLYKNHLDRTYGSQFLTVLTPAGSVAEFWRLVRVVGEKWALEVFSIWHWLLLACGAAAALLGRLRGLRLTAAQQAVLLQSGIALAGALVYFVLMARQYEDHEYYFLDSFYPGLALFLAFGLSCVPFSEKKTRWITTALFTGLLAAGALASQTVQRRKYGPRNYDFYEITRRNFTGADSLVQALGIPREARILVIDAAASNLPLLLLDRRGYTVLSTRRDEIAQAMRLPWDFVAIQDVSIPSEVVFPYPEILRELERMGGNGRVSIFRRRNDGGAAALTDFLGVRDVSATYTLDFEKTGEQPGWGPVVQIKTENDRSDNHFGFLLPEQEFSPTLEIPFAGAKAAKALWQGRFRGVGDPATIKITAVVEGPNGPVYYRDRTLTLHPAQGWQSYSVLFPGLPPGKTFKCYVWNPEHAGVEFDDWSVLFFD